MSIDLQELLRGMSACASACAFVSQFSTASALFKELNRVIDGKVRYYKIWDAAEKRVRFAKDHSSDGTPLETWMVEEWLDWLDVETSEVDENFPSIDVTSRSLPTWRKRLIKYAESRYPGLIKYEE